MAKKSSKHKKNRHKKKAKPGVQRVASEDNEPTTAPRAGGASLGTGRVVRAKVPKVSAKEKAALAKEAARANWAERMTSEGR